MYMYTYTHSLTHKHTYMHTCNATALDAMGIKHQVEQPVLECAYFIDIVITHPHPPTTSHSTPSTSPPPSASVSSPPSFPSSSSSSALQRIAVEVDGPTHYIHASMLPSKSRDTQGETHAHTPHTASAHGHDDEAVLPPVLNSSTHLKRKMLLKEGYQVWVSCIVYMNRFLYIYLYMYISIYVHIYSYIYICLDK